MSFPPHSNYRSSGSKWLGEIPAHWSLRRFKEIFKERDERSIDGLETLLSVSAYTGVGPRSEIIDEGNHLSRAETLEGYKVCYADDLVMNIMLAWNRGLAFSQHHGIVSPSYCVYELITKAEPRFLNYLVRSNEYTGYFKAFSSGVIDSRLRLYPDVFASLYCAVPPVAEQRKIADFLDGQTAKIDALVEEQQRLIELLKEKRQAVISHAVTKGLDHSVPMQDSGVEWLGQVPAHWRISKLKHVAQLSGGGTPSRDKPEFWGGSIPWISPKDMKVDYIDEAQECITEQGLASSASSLVAEGALLMVVRSGILQHTIPVAINSVPVALNQDMKAIRFKHENYARFFLNWIQGLNEQLLNLWAKQGATVESIEHSYLVNTVVALPAPSEVKNILKFLDREIQKFTDLTNQAELNILLLHERRAALISAAVTGKIDVRGIVSDEGKAARATRRRGIRLNSISSNTVPMGGLKQRTSTGPAMF